MTENQPTQPGRQSPNRSAIERWLSKGTPSRSQVPGTPKAPEKRVATNLADILEHVAARLGENVTLSLELRAENAGGCDDAAQRVVSENAANLGASGAGFE